MALVLNANNYVASTKYSRVSPVGISLDIVVFQMPSTE